MRRGREAYCSFECAQAATSAARVLIIAADLEAVKPLGDVLARRGMRVSVATEGIGALRSAVRTGVDLVLADAGAQPLDGIAVAAILGAESGTARIPVVILSERDDPNVRARAREVGAAEVMVRPAPAALLQLVSRCLAATVRGRGLRPAGGLAPSPQQPGAAGGR